MNRPADGYNNDEVAEWLRRWTANPMGSARVGSNPILVVIFFFFFLFFYVTLHVNISNALINNLSYCMLYSKLPYKMFNYIKIHSGC